MNIFSKQIKTLSAVLVLMAAPLSGAVSQSLIPSFGDARSGTSGFQFTKIAADARSSGMGLSNVADAADASSLYWNPGLAGQIQDAEVMLGHTQYFADISMEYLAYVHRYRSFVFGGSVQYLNSGDIDETTEFEPLGTGRTFRSVHASVGLTAAHEVTDLFSYGLTLRYLTERIEEIEVNSAAIDFGFFYRVGETGLRFAVGLNNFGFDATPDGSTVRTTLDGEEEIEDFEEISLPTRFSIGTAYDVYETDNLKAVITGQITNPSDNNEQFSLGGELGYMEQFFIRGGYQFGFEEIKLPSAGLGVKLPVSTYGIAADYAFSPYDRLGNLHRIALRIIL
ncbi:MAG: PorV/PorQ family protein [Bacteroidetes bacterium]|jgi:hypothetical protein|nr:PorV/PorQ family protein [Bacteroidota bacterium]